MLLGASEEPGCVAVGYYGKSVFSIEELYHSPLQATYCQAARLFASGLLSCASKCGPQSVFDNVKES